MILIRRRQSYKGFSTQNTNMHFSERGVACKTKPKKFNLYVLNATLSLCYNYFSNKNLQYLILAFNAKNAKRKQQIQDFCKLCVVNQKNLTIDSTFFLPEAYNKLPLNIDCCPVEGISGLH